MKKFTITTEIASDLTLEEVEDLFTELIDDKIGVLISGKGEYKQDTSFETFNYAKCPQVSNGGRPRCMWLGADDICKASSKSICQY